ncbi:MAG: hypothetical protein ACRDRH_21810 [Pseudonocardia sp.]
MRSRAAVVSSDGSFTPPTISEPTLVLRASYGAGHDLGVSWEWAVLDSLDVPLDRFGLRGGDPGQGLVPHADLGGLDTMRFTTEVLPLLAGVPGVAVEVSGRPASYREAGDSLRIGVSTDAVTGETDWFDLGVLGGAQTDFAVNWSRVSDEPRSALISRPAPRQIIRGPVR